ncbi:MAG: hypothetical protein HKN43_06790 [Rhodothermales bacterium]|nr:hypothetical protein [Rhodothermales bacterium]
MDNPSRSAAFQIGGWLVEPSLNQLTLDERSVRVEPKVMEVLVCLAENSGRPVSKEQFMQSVWAGTVVTDDVLSRCISELRKIFGDNPRKPEFIETIRKRGYRLVQPVVVPTEPATPELHGVEVGQSSGGDNDEMIAWLDADSSSIRSPLKLLSIVWTRRSSPWVWGSGLALIGIVISSMLFANWLRPVEVAEQPPRTVPFTTFPGEELDPALDPTGERVAFSWTGAGDGFDIYVKQIGGETPLQLTTSDGDERSPSWSPDGLKIAYIASKDGLNSIQIVPALPGPIREVAAFGVRSISNIVWSPDGSKLAVSAQNEVYGAYSLYLLSVETLEIVELTHPPRYYHGDTAPSFSKDGGALAFVRGVSGQIQDIYSVPTTGGEPRRLTSDFTEVTGLAWSDNNIVFASMRGGTSSLWRISRGGGTPEWIASAGDDASVSQVSTSAGGNLLTFARQTSDVNIWRYDIGITPGSVIASTRWDSNPDISKDGSKIAFVSDQSGNYEVWTADDRGEGAVQLTTMGAPLTSMPRWSPDGNKIAFVAWQDGAADIYTVDAAGGTPQPVVESPAEDISPSWSADGRFLYFSSNRSSGYQIWRKDLTKLEEDPVQVTSIGGLAAFESEDGASVYFVRPNEPGIWKIDVESDEVSMVLDSLEPTDWGNWEITNDGIYLIRRFQGKALVTFYSFRTRRSRNIATLTNVPDDPSFSVSSDGKWLLFSRIDRSESDIVLMEENG